MSLIELKSYFVYLKLDINCCIIFDYFRLIKNFFFRKKTRWLENGFSCKLKKFSVYMKPFCCIDEKKQEEKKRKCETTLCYTCRAEEHKQKTNCKNFFNSTVHLRYWYWTVYEKFLLKTKTNIFATEYNITYSG